MIFLYLLDCVSDIKSCCNDYGLANILASIKEALNIIHIIVPILLILSLAIGFIQLMINPDDKKKPKMVFIKIFSAVIVFFLPYLVNLSLSLLDGDGYQLGACWKSSEELKKEMENRENIFIPTTDKQKQSFILNSDDYDQPEISQNDFNDFAHLNQYNQTGTYANHSVCVGGGNSVAGTACGLSTYMAARYVLTGQDTNFMDFCHEACRTGLYNGNGSSWNILSSNSFYPDTYGIVSNSISSTYHSYVSTLQNGGVVSVLIGQGYANTSSGGFNSTANQHFILLAKYNSENNQIYVYNPTGANTGWQSKSIIDRYVVGCARGSWSLTKK